MRKSGYPGWGYFCRTGFTQELREFPTQVGESVTLRRILLQVFEQESVKGLLSQHVFERGKLLSQALQQPRKVGVAVDS